jgi:predicted secreted protein
MRRILGGNVRLSILLILALGFLLTACGQTAANSNTTVNASTAPVPSPTPANKTNNQAAADCPVSQAPADAGAFKPDVIVSQNTQNAGATQPITLTQGQRLEIRLQPGFTWELTTADPNHILTPVGPGGWYNASVHACIWRFTAASRGSAQLNYQGALVCPPLELCPSVEQSASYALTVR